MLVRQLALIIINSPITLLYASVDTAGWNRRARPRIAVIGGGISGSFVTKYLSDYDTACVLESITIFDPQSPIHQPLTVEEASTTTAELNHDDWQGGRITSLRLRDGTVVELGASVAFRDFHLVIEMIKGDPTLVMGVPFHPGISSTNDPNHTIPSESFGVYNGNGDWPVLQTRVPSHWMWRSWQIFQRYNKDLLAVTRAGDAVLKKFAQIPHILTHSDTSIIFRSTDAIWDAVHLASLAHQSFDSLLDSLHVAGKELPWWGWGRGLLPYQGSFRDELLTAMNIVNYNQNNTQVTALTGLGSWAPAAGGLFSIVGGNYQIIRSAIEQARTIRQTQCTERGDGGDDATSSTIHQVRKPITTIIGVHGSGFILYADEEILGEYDIVILAAPLQQARIRLLKQSHMDESVLQPMPLNGLVDDHMKPSVDGYGILPPKLPDGTTRRYTQVVTTVVSNATLNAEFFAIEPNHRPRSIMFTTKGKAASFNISGITHISTHGVYKMFSDNKLDDDVLQTVFGPYHKLEYVKVWGGPFGGATPDYRGNGTSLNFLLYDGAGEQEEVGGTGPGALYYTNVMEQSSLSCMEISAIGAKAVARLVAQRLGLRLPTMTNMRDEL